MSEKKTKEFSVKTLLILAGSYVSFGIGAGFATGAELLQFWASHGASAIFGLIMSSALILLCIAVVSRDCRKYKLANMEMMYKHYCGKYIGTAIQWFNTLTFFLMVGSMIAGGAASLHQAFNIPVFAGTVIMLAAVLGTSMLGMKKLTDILGNIAPIIMLAVVIICIYSYIHGTDGFTAGDQLIRAKSGLSMSGNLFFSAILNFTYVVLNMSAYSANVSTRASERACMGKCVGPDGHCVVSDFYLYRIYFKCLYRCRSRHSASDAGTETWNCILCILWNYRGIGNLHNSNRYGMGGCI